MRSIDLRVPAVAGFAVLLLAFAPGARAADTHEIQFVAGTGEAAIASPMALAGTDNDNVEAELNGLAERLADPRVQNGVADMVERVGGTMLDLPVGKFAAAIEKARPGRSKSTSAKTRPLPIWLVVTQNAFPANWARAAAR